MDAHLKFSKSYWCVAEGCNSDDMRKGENTDKWLMLNSSLPSREQSTNDQKEMAGFCKTMYQKDIIGLISNILLNTHRQNSIHTVNSFPIITITYKEPENFRPSIFIQKMNKVGDDSSCDLMSLHYFTYKIQNHRDLMSL